MFNSHKKNRDEDHLRGVPLFNEYKRLVFESDEDMFLDYDTILIAQYRQAIEDDLNNIKRLVGVMVLEEVDKTFKVRVQKSKELYRRLINEGDSRADYLEAVLKDLASLSLAGQDADKWWFSQYKE